MIASFVETAQWQRFATDVVGALCDSSIEILKAVSIGRELSANPKIARTLRLAPVIWNGAPAGGVGAAVAGDRPHDACRQAVSGVVRQNRSSRLAPKASVLERRDHAARAGGQ
jgi:hypothetical protein